MIAIRKIITTFMAVNDLEHSINIDSLIKKLNIHTKCNLIFIVVSYIFIAFFLENWILTDEVFYRSLSTQIPLYTVDGILESREKFWWVPYLIQIVVILIKVLFVSLCIFIGVVLSDIRIPFKNIFRVAVIAEIIFVIGQSIYLFNLYTHRAELTFETTANYFPLSMLSFFGVENVVSWLHYPLQTLNLFEVVYVVLISWLLSRQWKPDFIESLNIVIPSYGIGLLVWMILVVFLTLQIS